MKKPRQKHTPEYKRQAVELMKTQSPTKLALELGVSTSMLYKWRDALEKHQQDAFPGQGHRLPADNELHQLKREVELLRQENEFLKKMALFFAKEQP